MSLGHLVIYYSSLLHGESVFAKKPISVFFPENIMRKCKYGLENTEYGHCFLQRSYQGWLSAVFYAAVHLN